MDNFSGKNVLITGASSGIGLAMAKDFANRGANLILTARSEDKLIYQLVIRNLKQKVVV